jgi:hypothetical protein
LCEGGAGVAGAGDDSAEADAESTTAALACDGDVAAAGAGPELLSHPERLAAREAMTTASVIFFIGLSLCVIGFLRAALRLPGLIVIRESIFPSETQNRNPLMTEIDRILCRMRR